MWSKSQRSAILNIVKTTIVIFGITGDLSRRKLLPALSHIVASPDGADVSILGVSRRDVGVAGLISEAGGSDELAARTHIHTMDLAEPTDYWVLKARLNEDSPDQIVIYLSVPPGAAAQIVDLLGESGINDPRVRILFEKPFGFDEASARDVIARSSRYFTDDQLFRIDHYMAKEVAHEVIRLRRNAENHHHAWSNESIERIVVSAIESIGVEGRATFYEQTGALRDIIQGHLMQLLSLVLLRMPTEYTDEQLPGLRLATLESILPADPRLAVRAQYEGYQEEVENIGSLTETFVSLQLQSIDPRWKDVPLQLVTGKALNAKRTAIEVFYKDGSSDTFEEGAVHYDGRRLDAYERVLLEAIAGRRTIFTGSEEVIRSWEVVAPVQAHWEMEEIIKLYAQGSDAVSIITSDTSHI